jgi:hypothetical protein
MTTPNETSNAPITDEDREAAELVVTLPFSANRRSMVDHLAQAIANARAAGAAPQWTSTPPTVPGWYWARTPKGGVYPVEVVRPDPDGTDQVVYWPGGCSSHDDFDLWCGPITPPELPR